MSYNSIKPVIRVITFFIVEVFKNIISFKKIHTYLLINSNAFPMIIANQKVSKILLFKLLFRQSEFNRHL